MSSSNIQAILQDHSKQLAVALDIDSSSARIEVQCLLQTVLQVNRAWLLSHPEQSLAAAQHTRYMALLGRRLAGEPVAYLLGEREFFGLTFTVSPATLIPRPETELLVELALQRIPLHGTCRVLDLGTGSGAIALSIAHARPNAEVVAVDASQEALKVALHNTHTHRLDNVHLLLSDWFGALPGESFDLIVSNPPYIAAHDVHLAQGDVRFEPRDALISGTDGLDDIRRICTQAKAHLNPKGWLFFEHGHDQAAQTRELLQQADFKEIFSARDLSGIERISGGTRQTGTNSLG